MVPNIVNEVVQFCRCVEVCLECFFGLSGHLLVFVYADAKCIAVSLTVSYLRGWLGTNSVLYMPVLEKCT